MKKLETKTSGHGGIIKSCCNEIGMFTHEKTYVFPLLGNGVLLLMPSIDRFDSPQSIRLRRRGLFFFASSSTDAAAGVRQESSDSFGQS